MPGQTSSSVAIDAEPDAVMAVIADFDAYPTWVDSMERATVLRETDGWADEVEMVLAHRLFSDTCTLAVDASLPMIGPLRRKAERTIVEGALRGLERRVEA